MRLIKKFLQDGHAQDLVEYTLIMAFVCLASAGLFLDAGGAAKGIWGRANTVLSRDTCPLVANRMGIMTTG